MITIMTKIAFPLSQIVLIGLCFCNHSMATSLFHAIELPAYLNYGFINLPGAMSPPFKDAESGLGYAGGLGYRIKFGDKYALKIGYVHTNLKLKTEVETTGYSVIREDGTLSYNGIYVYLIKFYNNFFIQCGFDTGGEPTFNGDAVLNPGEKNETVYKNQKHSILTDSFNNLFHIYVGGGYDWNLNKKMDLGLEYDLAFLSSAIYTSGATAVTPVFNNGSASGDWETDTVDLSYLLTSKVGICIKYYFNESEF